MKNTMIGMLLGMILFACQAAPGGGCHLGQNRINNAALECMCREIPLSTFIPYEFPPDPGCWYRQDSIDTYITPETVAIALNLSQFPTDMRLKSVQEHMSANNLFGSIFRFSERIGSLL
jgi:hypothetical protein